jgi:hypothetical protein
MKLRLELKIILADLGLRKLTAADTWAIRKELQQLYKRSSQIDPFASEEDEREFAWLDREIRYLEKMLFSLKYLGKIKEPAAAWETEKADSL